MFIRLFFYLKIYERKKGNKKGTFNSFFDIQDFFKFTKLNDLRKKRKHYDTQNMI